MTYREDIPGYMSTEDLMSIEALASCVPEAGTVVEVGSYFGRSAWAWAHSVRPAVKVYCIDPWPGIKGDEVPSTKKKEAALEEFQDNVKDCPNIIPIKGYSPEMPWDRNLRPDLVFIDGNHFSPYVDNDLAFWAAQLNSHGILCGHDFNPLRWPDVCEAVIRQAGLLKKPFRIFEGSTIWYIELGREKLSPKNREVQIGRIFIEDMSWAPSPLHIQLIQKIYSSEDTEV